MMIQVHSGRDPDPDPKPSSIDRMPAFSNPSRGSRLSEEEKRGHGIEGEARGQSSVTGNHHQLSPVPKKLPLGGDERQKWQTLSGGFLQIPCHLLQAPLD